jgi:hypothetical protein
MKILELILECYDRIVAIIGHAIILWYYHDRIYISVEMMAYALELAHAPLSCLILWYTLETISSIMPYTHMSWSIYGSLDAPKIISYHNVLIRWRNSNDCTRYSRYTRWLIHSYQYSCTSNRDQGTLKSVSYRNIFSCGKNLISAQRWSGISVHSLYLSWRILGFNRRQSMWLIRCFVWDMNQHQYG